MVSFIFYSGLQKVHSNHPAIIIQLWFSSFEWLSVRAFVDSTYPAMTRKDENFKMMFVYTSLHIKSEPNVVGKTIVEVLEIFIFYLLLSISVNTGSYPSRHAMLLWVPLFLQYHYFHWQTCHTPFAQSHISKSTSCLLAWPKGITDHWIVFCKGGSTV